MPARPRRRAGGGPLVRIALAAALAGLGAAAAPADPAQVTLRRDHPDLSFADLSTMTPAALGDALLAPGHPAIETARRLPEGMAPPFPPGSPVRLAVRLIAAAVLDPPSGFCVRRDWEVVIVAPGTVGQADTIKSSTGYALPIAGGCGGRPQSYFTVLPGDRPRAFTVARLLASASAAAKKAPPAFPVTVDDQEGRELGAYERAHPDPRNAPIATITDPKAALAMLPVDSIDYVGHHSFGDLFGSASISPDLLTGTHGPRERWDLLMGGDWTVDLVLDGNRIAAMALRRRIPPPF